MSKSNGPDPTRTERHECPYCDKVAKDANGLWMHVRKVHPKRKSSHLRPVVEDESMRPVFQAMKEHRKEQGRINYARANPKGWTIHCDTHWSQKFLGSRLDYWPTRNKFRYEGRTHTGDVVGFMKNRMNDFLQSHDPTSD